MCLAFSRFVNRIVFVSAAIFLMLPFASAQVVPPSGTLLSRQAVVINPLSHKVYAVDKDLGAVSVINAINNHIESLKVDEEPVAIAVNSVSGRVYVVNNGSGTVSVLDGQNDSVISTVDVGARPYVLAVERGDQQNLRLEHFQRCLDHY